MAKNWKDLLLKSGLPLEYEVQEILEQYKCITSYENEYHRINEKNELTIFSYDINASFFSGKYCVNLLVECKYKSEGIKWFFIPDNYYYYYDDSLNYNSFMHPINLTETTYIMGCMNPYYKAYPNMMGNFCNKGVEITKEGEFEHSIIRAINQLSYGFINQIIDNIDSQFSDIKHLSEMTNCNIPIIITTADLYRLKTNASIDAIKKAESIEEVAEPTDFILYHNKIGNELLSHNVQRLNRYFSNIDEDILKTKFKNDDISDYIRTLSNSSPECIIIMKHHKDNYEKLFNYLQTLLNPTEELKLKFQKIVDDLNEQSKLFHEKFKSLKKKNSDVNNKT